MWKKILILIRTFIFLNGMKIMGWLTKKGVIQLNTVVAHEGLYLGAQWSYSGDRLGSQC